MDGVQGGGRGCNNSSSASATIENEIHKEAEDQMDLRRGPWTVEEDLALMNYIANHGEGRWNSLARCAGKFIFHDFFHNVMINLVLFWGTFFLPFLCFIEMGFFLALK